MIKSTLSKILPPRRTTILLSLSFFIPLILISVVFFIWRTIDNLDAAESNSWLVQYEVQPPWIYFTDFILIMYYAALPVATKTLAGTLAIYYLYRIIRKSFIYIKQAFTN